MSEQDFTYAFERYLRKQTLRDFPDLSGIYREISGFQGIPDMITIHGGKPRLNQIRILKKVLDQAGRVSLNILSLFISGQIHSVQYVTKRINVSDATIIKSLSRLESMGLLSRTKNNTFLLSSRYIMPDFEIWAFEMKISNWKRALFQTTQAKAFADKAIAVFPIEREDLIKSNLTAFKKMRVGLLLFDANKMTHKFVVKPASTVHKIDRFKLYTLAQIAKES